MCAAGEIAFRERARPDFANETRGCAQRPIGNGPPRTTSKIALYMWEQWCRRPTLVDILQPFEVAACEHTLGGGWLSACVGRVCYGGFEMMTSPRPG
jgi:hypothetical protein